MGIERMARYTVSCEVIVILPDGVKAEDYCDEIAESITEVIDQAHASNDVGSIELDDSTSCEASFVELVK